MPLKIQSANLATIIPDEATRAEVNQLLSNVTMTDSNGGMTLDMGTGPIVIAHGKPSLADEKAIREVLKQLNPKARFSRTNDIKVRCEQYAVATNAKHFAKLFGPKTDDADTQPAKRKTGKKNTPVADTQPVNVIEQVMDTPTTNEPVAEPVNA